MTEKEKMLRGEYYSPIDPELVREREEAESKLLRFNAVCGSTERRKVLQELLGSMGEEVEIRSPFFCDYGYNIHLGNNVFLNFNCVLLDVMPIYIGDRTQIGPGVHIYAADHPRDPELRRIDKENGKSVFIGKNVWIGGGAIVLPGVTIGDDAIIGAGAVVLHNVEPGMTVVGNPARPAQRK